LEGIEYLRSMRKRRVGVTARSRQNVGNQATGTLQFGTEMAAPLELRTPAGTCGKKGCKESADGSMATMARGEGNGQKNNPRRSSMGEGRAVELGSGALDARMRRCLILRQGASPLRPPAPFPSRSRFQNGGNQSRVRKPRKTGAPLTDSPHSEDIAGMRERGLLARARGMVSRRGEGTARYARMRRCLILRQGASPLKPLCPRKLFS
jgi:hypothetical protein